MHPDTCGCDFRHPRIVIQAVFLCFLSICTQALLASGLSFITHWRQNIYNQRKILRLITQISNTYHMCICSPDLCPKITICATWVF